VNTVSATVLAEDDKPSSISPNNVSFSVRTYRALSIAAGDKQTGQILAKLPIQPSVKLVDSLGKPRLGVPVTFAPTGGGTVAASTVSTGADGTASPGDWILGDTPGSQSLVATVELSSVTLTATGTGTPVHFAPLAIIAGGQATCAIDIDQSVKCMGEEPKVGDSSTVNKSKPTPVVQDIHLIQLAGAPTTPSHFCGVGVDQALYCWGKNVYPDSADTTVFDAIYPRKIKTDSTLALVFVQASAGQAHSCALTNNLITYCWGDNSAGQLGDRTTKTRFGLAPVVGGFKFASISTGAGHNCGLTSAGLGFCWGYNQNGGIGDGTTIGRTSPTAISGGLSFMSLSAGNFFTCGIATDGRPYCWGGLAGLTANTLTPHLYPDTPAFQTVTSGGNHACALTVDGVAYCWGDNTFGQVGDSTTVQRAAPTKVNTDIRFKTLSAGYTHTCGAAFDGSVACWGRNFAGELGDSTLTPRLVPRYLVLKVIPDAGASSVRAIRSRAIPIKRSSRP
jgi:hypothetical protein